MEASPSGEHAPQDCVPLRTAIPIRAATPLRTVFPSQQHFLQDSTSLREAFLSGQPFPSWLHFSQGSTPQSSVPLNQVQVRVLLTSQQLPLEVRVFLRTTSCSRFCSLYVSIPLRRAQNSEWNSPQDRVSLGTVFSLQQHSSQTTDPLRASSSHPDSFPLGSISQDSVPFRATFP